MRAVLVFPSTISRTGFQSPLSTKGSSQGYGSALGEVLCRDKGKACMMILSFSPHDTQPFRSTSMLLSRLLTLAFLAATAAAHLWTGAAPRHARNYKHARGFLPHLRRRWQHLDQQQSLAVPDLPRRAPSEPPVFKCGFKHKHNPTLEAELRPHVEHNLALIRNGTRVHKRDGVSRPKPSADDLPMS